MTDKKLKNKLNETLKQVAIEKQIPVWMLLGKKRPKKKVNVK